MRCKAEKRGRVFSEELSVRQKPCGNRRRQFGTSRALPGPRRRRRAVPAPPGPDWWGAVGLAVCLACLAFPLVLLGLALARDPQWHSRSTVDRPAATYPRSDFAGLQTSAHSRAKLRAVVFCPGICGAAQAAQRVKAHLFARKCPRRWNAAPANRGTGLTCGQLTRGRPQAAPCQYKDKSENRPAGGVLTSSKTTYRPGTESWT
jgi:hypothetical protein